MNKDERNNSENESEIESKVVTVGSNQGHRALMIVALAVLIGGVYYFYLRPPSTESPEIITKEEIKQNFQELKENLEQVPDNIIVPERIITNPLPPLPPLPTPPIIPAVKKKEEIVIKAEEKPKETPMSNIPLLPTQRNISSSNINSNFPTSFPTIGGGGYPKDRRTAQMLALSGGGDKEGKIDDITLSNTSAQSSKATKVGKLGFMITQGKIIDVILETAISSDLQGMLRAVVSRDVYAETGDTILIPKGSRLIGGYTFDSNIAKARVNINWNRVILPHGIDIAISSPGTDELGRAGIGGIVDNKIASSLFSSILLAGVSIGSAVIGQKASNLVDSLTIMDAARSIVGTEIDVYSFRDSIIKGLDKDTDREIKEKVQDATKEKWKLDAKAIEKINNAKTQQDLLSIMKKEIASLLGIRDDQVGIDLDDINALLKQIQRKSKSVYDTAIEKSINDFSKDMRDIVDRSIDKKPTIYVHQGTSLKVFVNQDIVFPPQAILHR
ncbi:TrbI/VirB10 family protein [Wolbachia endosymbiont of Folsomia candida]|uniref:TrbI/VirB10 family protein n=1 Tax=Wolbachia endosymbiont of Folsomia candida TaxID=169402 RepID=UPI000AE06EDB|nr:TrbI/VirB10 family protein [Wolbachia endosymbiont of Folsomia candida]APR97950.1 type VI secretion protein [Wolbachia endosymbiont of Folsomia candida]